LGSENLKLVILISYVPPSANFGCMALFHINLALKRGVFVFVCAQGWIGSIGRGKRFFEFLLRRFIGRPKIELRVKFFILVFIVMRSWVSSCREGSSVVKGRRRIERREMIEK
jgi:hypothetical protein